MSAPYLDGWQAHLAGAEQEPNPYDEARQPYSHRQWLSGWCARYDAVKHGHDLSLDATDGFTP